MGLLVFNLKRLPAPFDYINESVFEIPSSRSIRISTRRIRIIFVLDGEARLGLSAKSTMSLRAGDVLLLPAACRYSYHPQLPGRSARLHVLVISLRNKHSCPWVERLMRRGTGADFLLANAQTAAMLHYIHLLRSEAERGGRDAATAAGALATLLLLLLGRNNGHSPQKPARQAKAGRYLVEQAMEFIFKNHEGAISLADIAWHLRLSEEYLSRLFKQETGHTVFEFVREARLNAAKRLLSGTNHTIAQISEMCGFSSSAVFCRSFKKAFAKSPAAYRSKHGGNPNSTLTELI